MAAPQPRPDRPAGWRQLLAEPEIAMCQAILGLILVLASVQVVLRYVFAAPLSWPEELSGLLVVWLTFLGAAGVARRGEHVRVELVEELVGPGVRRWLYPLYDAVILAFLIYLVIGGVELYRQMEYERTPAMRLPVRYGMAIVPISAALMAAYYAWSLARSARDLLRRGDAG